MATSSSHSRSRPPRRDIITRLHSDALETPTTLLGGLDISNNQVIENSSSSESEFQPSNKSAKLPPRHARSISNPFPSFLNGSNQKQGSTRQAQDTYLDWEDGDASAMAGPSVANARHKRTPAGSKDFATGNCMACSSLMRWPKDLKVFKCTICATINDLVVPSGESNKSGFLGRRREGNAPAFADGQSCQPISTQHCRQLVRRCIHSYISNKLVPNQSPGPASWAFKNGSQNCLQRPEINENAHDGNHDLSSGALYRRGQEEYTPKYVFEDQPTLRLNPPRPNTASRSYSSSYAEMPPPRVKPSNQENTVYRRALSISHEYEPKKIFKPLEEYIVKAFASLGSVNSSFALNLRGRGGNGTEHVRRKPVPSRGRSTSGTDLNVPHKEVQPDNSIDEIDAKMLLLGDVAENGLWWTGGRSQLVPPKPTTGRSVSPQKKTTASKITNFDWDEMDTWYGLATNAAEDWFAVYEDICKNPAAQPQSQRDLQLLEQELLQGQSHLQRVLLKATESLLKRPGRPITTPDDIRFLIIIMENPLLHPNCKPFRGILQPDAVSAATPQMPPTISKRSVLPVSGLLSGQHSGILKRVIGISSNAPAGCHNQLITWLAKFDNSRFARIKDLVSGFLSYRLLKQIDKKHHTEVDITAGLIPEMRTGRSAGGSYLHDEIRSGGTSKKQEPEQKIAYTEDWQIKAASRVLALIFAGNNTPGQKHGNSAQAGFNVATGSTREYGSLGGQILPTSDFYNSMIDYADLVSDFESWESKRTKFSFCQYPFLMSIWAKTHILEHDARRQMQMKARDAFLDSIMTNRNIKQYLSLTVRRDCLVEDSLAAVSEVIGSGTEDIKKGLRITFKGEEGIDGGGLRKEWFLLLIREVFNPDHGMFLYDEDSQYCYFNPNTFETSDQFFLVGVVMGLAIYNSTILDVALPPFAFRKLLAAAPAHGLGISSRPRPSMQYTLNDLAEYRPRVAHGLRQLLDFEGDVENTFCLDFVIDTEKYGTSVQVPLCPGGERKAVTNSNKRDYVDLYVRYILETAVTRQFEPFKRGFYTVCGGNAFSLFRPEEIELLIRGSDEALDIASLRAIAEYDNWGHRQPDGNINVVGWFWETFQEATPAHQRKLLSFITGSDRIPATGAAMLPIKISCLGEDSGRYPIARTCFNMISLWEYGSKQRLEGMLWRAVFESEGFGLK
ncbi:putative E3 ubiquitin-protein ligase [Conoideocrella luteorostrata]|uniref:HECT-type E3 ubiquitin transferase n=1 Tax=Conoideocrella luteorostrata TaxID=1105319 RepID=A0AAJ0CER5_9HYPO|nr:putative E3 ubiquitin-protein ligase [Conoideocrella luteorostrata]